MSNDGPREDMHRVEAVGGRAVYADGSGGTYRAWADGTGLDSVSLTLVQCVAAATGRDPARLEPLADTIDPDAVEGLVAHWRRIGAATHVPRLSFQYEECEVTIHGDGEVVVDPKRH